MAAAKASQSGVLHDPIEDDPQYRNLVQQAEAEAEQALKGRDRDVGFCHLVCATQRDILQNKHGVVWFTPSEMNPGMLFD